MKKAIFELILQLIIVIPLIIIFLKKRNSKNWNITFVFFAFFIVSGLVVFLPVEFKSFHLFNGGDWNFLGLANNQKRKYFIDNDITFISKSYKELI